MAQILARHTRRSSGSRRKRGITRAATDLARCDSNVVYARVLLNDEAELPQSGEDCIPMGDHGNEKVGVFHKKGGPTRCTLTIVIHQPQAAQANGSTAHSSGKARYPTVPKTRFARSRGTRDSSRSLQPARRAARFPFLKSAHGVPGSAWPTATSVSNCPTTRPSPPTKRAVARSPAHPTRGVRSRVFVGVSRFLSTSPTETDRAFQKACPAETMMGSDNHRNRESGYAAFGPMRLNESLPSGTR
jgi:hypothetical protein